LSIFIEVWYVIFLYTYYNLGTIFCFVSVQLSCSVVSNSLWTCSMPGLPVHVLFTNVYSVKYWSHLGLFSKYYSIYRGEMEWHSSCWGNLWFHCIKLIATMDIAWYATWRNIKFCWTWCLPLGKISRKWKKQTKTCLPRYSVKQHQAKVPNLDNRD